MAFAAAWALASMGCATLFQPIDDNVSFPLVSPDPDRLLTSAPEYAYRLRASTPLTPGAPGGLALPDGPRGGLFHGAIPVGARPMHVLAERLENGSFLFWIDRDRDRDLDGETPLEWTPSTDPVFLARFDAPPPEARVGDDPLKFRLSARMSDSDAPTSPTFEGFAHWRATARFSQSETPAMVFPADWGLNPDDPRIRFAVDLNRDGTIAGETDSLEHFDADDVVRFLGARWRLAEFDPDGGSLRFENAASDAPPRPPLNVGDPAPWFETTTVDGEPFDLESRRGDAILIDFWSGRSRTFERQVSFLRELHDEYGDRGLTIVRVNLDETPAGENRPLLGAPWIEIAGAGGRQNEIARLFRVQSAPWTVLIGRDGLIAAKNISRGSIEREIEAVADDPPVEATPGGYRELWLDRILNAR